MKRKIIALSCALVFSPACFADSFFSPPASNSSSISIGDTVDGSTPFDVLYIDAGGNLAQSNNLQFNGDSVLTISNPSTAGQINIGAEGAVNYDGFGNFTVTNTGVGQQLAFAASGAVSLQDSTGSAGGLVLNAGNTYIRKTLQIGAGYDIIDQSNKSSIDSNNRELICSDGATICERWSGSTVTLTGLTYPTTDGAAGAVMTTNGGGVLSLTTLANPTVVASVSPATLNSAAPTLLVYTTPSGNHTYRVGGNITVITIAGSTVAEQISYTDETSTVRTITLIPPGAVSGNVTTVGAFAESSINIRVKGGTTITGATVVGVGAQTYNPGMSLELLY